jgi:hypothetical protein
MKPPYVLLAALLLSACGPVQSTAFLLDADVQLNAARTAGAEKYAPYDFTAAQLYLVKAREEVGYSDYEAALDFARKAAEHARKAREDSLAAANQAIPDVQGPSEAR